MKSLKKAREDAGFTIIEASEKLGINKSTLCNYEKGRSYPDIRILKKIEKLYNIDYQDIFFEKIS